MNETPIALRSDRLRDAQRKAAAEGRIVETVTPAGEVVEAEVNSNGETVATYITENNREETSNA